VSTVTVALCLFLGCMSSVRRGSRGHLNVPTYATVQQSEGGQSYGANSPRHAGSLRQQLLAGADIVE
jgi:hypothetical protein